MLIKYFAFEFDLELLTYRKSMSLQPFFMTDLIDGFFPFFLIKMNFDLSLLEKAGDHRTDLKRKVHFFPVIHAFAKRCFHFNQC